MTSIGFIFMLIYLVMILAGKTFASPPFGHEEIPDSLKNWAVKKNKANYFEENGNLIYIFFNNAVKTEILSRISSVTASSDGKILNVTFWLTGPFNKNPVKNSPEYYIKFDSDSNSNTGDNFGNEYMFNVSWINKSKTWNQKFQEFSPKGPLRLIDNNNNYTNFFSPYDRLIFNKTVLRSSSELLDELLQNKIGDYSGLYCCYVTFPIDLKLMNYPDKYTMSFYVKDRLNADYINFKDNTKKGTKAFNLTGPVEFLDSAGVISIPKPTFEYASESENITVTPSHKSEPIIVISKSEYPVRLGLIVNDKNLSKFISINDNPQYLEPNGKAVFNLKYNGSFDKTGSNLLRINQTVYHRLDVGTDAVVYDSKGTIDLRQSYCL